MYRKMSSEPIFLSNYFLTIKFISTEKVVKKTEDQ